MKYLFSSLKPTKDFDSYVDIENNTVQLIGTLSKVNIFVGSNNSGKSRFLREVMKMEKYLFNAKEIQSWIDILKKISKDLRQIKEIGGKHIVIFQIQDYGLVKIEDFRVYDFDHINFSFDFDKYKKLLIALRDHSESMRIDTYSGSGDIEGFKGNIKHFISQNKEEINFFVNTVVKEISFNKVYIPILRSLNNFNIDANSENKRDIFSERVSKIYGINLNEKQKIFTGQDLYEQLKKKLLGDYDARKEIADYENFLSTEIFENKKVSLIPKIDSDVLNIKIGLEEKEIYNLGDGIQNLIILTYYLFTTDNSLFFIEEPETNLHPGMQRKFLEIILSNRGVLSKKNHQYFLTTHSNHLLDMSLDYQDISIFKFSRHDVENKHLKIIEQISSGDERVLLELGVKNSSVFLTNATIWVEGITDRLYIKKFLDLYQQNFPKKVKIFEDVDYSFVEYGGNNITHWSFLDSKYPPIYINRLCGKSIIVTDKDGKTKISRQKELRKKLGKRYICLDCREIENILSLKTFEKTIKKYPKEASFVMPNFPQIYPHKNEKIGIFIDKKMKPINSYSEKSGALRGDKKLDFCQKVIMDLEFNELTNGANSLTKKIYEFILSQKI